LNWNFVDLFQQRSPIDILLRVFPSRRRSEVELALQRCKGDVLQAIELLTCSGAVAASAAANAAAELHSAVAPTSPFHEELKSAFSPLAFPAGLAAIAAAASGVPGGHHRYGAAGGRNRFLASPFSGTGYFSTIIRPPPDFSAYGGLGGQGGRPSPHHLSDYFGIDAAKAAAASPASNAGSDKTSYSD